MTMRVGFIGLGNQGRPIAAHLAPAGFETTVYDLDAARAAELAETGARVAGSAREVGEHADVVGVCVPEDAHVLAVATGDDGLFAGLQPGGVVLVHSTVLPSTVERLAEEAAVRGIDVIDACVTGGAQRAQARQVTWLVGGEASLLDKVRPYLDAASTIAPIHAGPVGSGAKLKLCINLVTYIQWAAAFESMALARAIGLSQDVLEEAGRSNGQLTDLMVAFLALHKAPVESRESERFQDMLRGHVRIAEKDLAWALRLAREAELALPVGGVVAQSLARIYGLDDANRR
jgi:3-hydroxyisobutyrate dehydrogenase-like beta-hydroxyacid dehydrogenase